MIAQKERLEGNLIAVVDVQWLGSLPTFHIAVVECLLTMGCRVVSFSPAPGDVFEHPCVRSSQKRRLVGRQVGSARNADSTKAAPAGGSSILRRFCRRYAPSWVRKRRDEYLARKGWESLCNRISDFRWRNGDAIEHVIFPYLDYPAISLVAGSGRDLRDLDMSWSGLWVHPDFRPEALTDFQTIVRKLERLCNFRGLWSFGTSLAEELTAIGSNLWLGLFPDLTYEEFPDTKGPLEVEIEQIREIGPVVLLIGELSPRKGIHEMLAVARESESDGLSLQFVIAGPLDHASCGEKEYSDLVSALENASASVHFRPGWIETDLEFNGAIRGCSIVWGVYRDFPFSSNLLTKASLANRPIVVSSGGLMAERVKEFGLGAVADTNDPRAVMQTLKELAYAVGVSEEDRALRRTFASSNGRWRLQEIIQKALFSPEGPDRTVVSHELTSR